MNNVNIYHFFYFFLYLNYTFIENILLGSPGSERRRHIEKKKQRQKHQNKMIQEDLSIFKTTKRPMALTEQLIGWYLCEFGGSDFLKHILEPLLNLITNKQSELRCEVIKIITIPITTNKNDH